MRTPFEQLMEMQRISSRITELSAEKARIDADIARAATELRELFTERILQGSYAPHRHTNLADTTTASEIACLLRISERTAHRLVQHSVLLVQYHPKTLDALHAGTISWAHATTLLYEYAALPSGTAAAMEEALLPIAADTTVSRLAHRARKLRTQLHPTSLQDRARTAVQDRRVDLEPADDAMAWLHIHLPATDATAIDTRLTTTARTLQTPAEHRTLPQLRTDILTDLLLTRYGPADVGDGKEDAYRVQAHINVTVPVLTLLGLDDTPADLEGYGPIPADTARHLAAHAPSFTRLLTHPETGAVLSVGRTTYAVPADLKKWLRVRDRTCRHPGCNTPASRCELDHTTPWSHHGTTAHNNLSHLCRKHHMLKTEGIWHYTQPTPGTITATSPAGRTYTTASDPPPF
ncbi:HNH endonuclease signature motif containing protein [Arthrobacter sp. MDB2-24]